LVHTSAQPPPRRHKCSHLVHDDGDQEELEEYEAYEAVEAFAQHRPPDSSEWRSEGHEYMGKRIERTFGAGRVVLGTLTKWLPEVKEEGEPALFRAVHDDGDEEDLDEHEAEEAIAAFAARPVPRVTRHSRA